MNVLWLSWKDQRHPEAGGAEIVAREISKRLIAEGHDVTLLTCGYEGAPKEETIDGLKIIRVGNNRYVHPFQACLYYLRHMRNKFDVLIEEVNGAPYFSVLFERRAKRYLLYHQMEGPVWFYETRKPLSHVGRYALEPVASRLLSMSRTPVVTVSDSTASDLARHGFALDRTHIISEGIEIDALPSLQSTQKFEHPTVLSLGAMRAMKRTVDQIIAFEIAKASIPDLQLKIAGKSDSEYGRKVLERIETSPFRGDIEYLGAVSRAKKIELMQKAHAILQTAVHEGWGLTITEAASQGTPAVVYNVNGLRDSVKHQQTGIITDPSPASLAHGIVKLLSPGEQYEAMRRAGWQWSKSITFDQSYSDFKRAIGVEV
jgi:glycosyltransferase involved in cell wall biosynthesis